MIDITNITLEALAERSETLPASLQAALHDASLKATVNQAAADAVLSSEDIVTLQQIVGLVIMGFVPINELDEQIEEFIEVKDGAALEKITGTLSGKVFEPLRFDIEKNYHPFKPLVASIPLDMPAPLPVKLPVAPIPVTIAPPPGVSTPVTPAKPPAPLSMHVESSFAPIKRPESFVQDKKLEAFFRKPAPPPPPASAKLEIGSVTKPAPLPAVTKTQPEQVRVVHYGELKSLLNNVPTPPPSPAGVPAPVSLGSIGRTPLPGVRGVPPSPPAPQAPSPFK